MHSTVKAILSGEGLNNATHIFIFLITLIAPKNKQWTIQVYMLITRSVEEHSNI